MSQHLQQSATEKLRLHWSRLRFLPLGHYRTDNPQLKSCGSIEASVFLAWYYRDCMQSATEKLRLHWSLANLRVSSTDSPSIRNWKVAAPLKLVFCCWQNLKVSTIRNWKVAAPLKRTHDWRRSHQLYINPQLKSCGSIEAYILGIQLCGVGLQSATEKLRLHWSYYDQDDPNFPESHNPQLKSCGYIEAAQILRMAWSIIINPQLKSCGSIEAPLTLDVMIMVHLQSATEKLRLHWSYLCGIRAGGFQLPIRNWKVAAPLKLAYDGVYFSPWFYNPQLKSCGSIEAVSFFMAINANDLQSATEKLRLHWSKKNTDPSTLTAINPQLKSCGSIEATKIYLSESPTNFNPQLKSCGSIEAD